MQSQLRQTLVIGLPRPNSKNSEFDSNQVYALDGQIDPRDLESFENQMKIEEENVVNMKANGV